MSRFRENVRWLLNGEVQLLFFIIGHTSDVGELPDLNSEGFWFCYFDYREEEPVILLEVRFKDSDNRDTSDVISRVFEKLKEQCVVCTFDGSYQGIDGLLSHLNSGHIHAAKTAFDSISTVHDEELLSEAWREKLGKIQDRISERLQQLS